MTTPQQAAQSPPTPRQLWYLGLLSAQKGQTFVQPLTFEAASRKIAELRHSPPFRNRFLGA